MFIRQATLIRAIYRAVLNREPESEGLAHYQARLDRGDNIEMILSDILHSLESSRLLGSRSNELNHDRHGCPAAEIRALVEKFPIYRGAGQPSYITNFLGAVTRTSFVNLPHLSGKVESEPIDGNFHAGPTEWMGILLAILEAKRSFTMVEVGAGFAPWCVACYRAAMARKLEIQLTALEPDPGHIEFIRANILDNDIPNSAIDIIEAAVGVNDGTIRFPIAARPSSVYGGVAAFGDATLHKRFMHAHSHEIVEERNVRCVGLGGLLRRKNRIDLLHCDIQGSEAEVIPAAIDAINDHVVWAVVGTHSFSIDRLLVNLFREHKWELMGIDAAGSKTDGTQVWRNTRFTKGEPHSTA